MPLPYPTQSGINQLLDRLEFIKAIQELEKKFPNNSNLHIFKGDANRIKDSRLKGIKTSQEIAALENLLASNIREWMENAPDAEVKKVMIFFNNAPNSTDIKLSKESGDIEKVFSRSPNPSFSLIIKNHLDYAEILDQISRERPYIVQFSMHADSERGLKMTDETGNKRFIDKERFKNDMRFLNNPPFLHGLMLNGCNTQPVAEAAKGIIPFIMATRSSIADEAARIFSATFYHSLLNHPENSIEWCFSAAVKKLGDSEDEDVKNNANIPIII